jgi:hypothetical protein
MGAGTASSLVTREVGPACPIRKAAVISASHRRKRGLSWVLVSLWWIPALLLVAALAAQAAPREELTIRNAALSRTISWFDGPLRTTKLEAGGYQAIRQVGVEFLIDLDVKGQPVTLSPSDFEIRGISTDKIDQESRVSLNMHCLKEGYPLQIYLKYHSIPGAGYLQKSIRIVPCKQPQGAVLRRVTLEYCGLKPELLPVSFAESDTPSSDSLVFGPVSTFGAFDAKAGKGLFFFITSATGVENYSPGRGLMMAENASTPLEQGYQTGRATIGLANGSPEDLYRQFRQFVWRNYPPYAIGSGWYGVDVSQPIERLKLSIVGAISGLPRSGIRRIPDPSPELAAYLKRFFAFRKRFERYFDQYQQVMGVPDGKDVDGEGHIVDNSGFVVLFNPSQESRKVLLPLDEPGLGLSGELRLSDWSELESGVDMGVAKPGDPVEVTLPPVSAKIIGINIVP